ncbi:MAG: hypothetical protein WAV00_18950 [Nocardioides sp.]
MTNSGVPTVRRWVVRLTIGSFSLAALMGVAALLRPGRFGSTEGRILLTTVIVGVTSVLMLCYLAASGERSRVLGEAGGVAALVAATGILVAIWGWPDTDPPIALVRTFGVASVLALTLAQFSLLVSVVHRRPSLVRLLAATMALGTMLATMLAVAILGWNPNDTGARLIGVVAILDVLGTVVTMAIGVFGSQARPPDASLGLTLPPDLADAVRARAEATGRTPDQVVLDAVRGYVASDADA